MRSFLINNTLWKVVTVPFGSQYLKDRTGTYTVATTDPTTNCIYISDSLYGHFKKRVIAHELGHAVCVSYGLIDDIARCCYPDMRIEMEEMMCNFVADYGELIFEMTYKILGDEALVRLPNFLAERIA